MKWMLRWIDMSGPPGLLRRSLAIICIGIGILGAVAPIIPGWPAFLFAIVLLGRRDRSVRLTHLVLRRTLRWLRRRPHPSMRQIGRQVSSHYVRLRRFLTPALISMENAMKQS
ncbi:MAG: hypothetical protein MUD01_28095 [Chloroflexaceae bacterium]|nr:hypothetical protein [Chloroflexaceae bacterium]